jgi:hypothetical protein
MADKAINLFAKLIGTAEFHIPFSSQWAVFITIPDKLKESLELVQELEYRGSNWNVNKGNRDRLLNPLNDSNIAAGDGDNVGCIFADEVTLIDDMYGVADATIGEDGTTGGIIPGIYTKNRQPFSQKKLSIKFRETNLSFADYIIRPWMILASHLGRIATSNNIIKSDIIIYQYSKIKINADDDTINKPSISIRKRFDYYGCTPTSIGGMPLNYESKLVSYDSSWCFDSYAISDDTAAAEREVQVSRGAFDNEDTRDALEEVTRPRDQRGRNNRGGPGR